MTQQAENVGTEGQMRRRLRNGRYLLRNLRPIREGRMLTQTQLADRVGMTQSGLSVLERLKGSSTLPTAENVARALGVDVSDLYSEFYDGAEELEIDPEYDPSKWAKASAHRKHMAREARTREASMRAPQEDPAPEQDWPPKEYGDPKPSAKPSAKPADAPLNGAVNQPMEMPRKIGTQEIHLFEWLVDLIALQVARHLADETGDRMAESLTPRIAERLGKDFAEQIATRVARDLNRTTFEPLLARIGGVEESLNQMVSDLY